MYEEEKLIHQFAIRPRKMVGKERYLDGWVWISNEDAEIVRIKGQGVGYAKPLPNTTHCFPEFETMFDKHSSVDNHWVPIFSKTLAGMCPDSRIRMEMTWTDYKHAPIEKVTAELCRATPR